MATQAGKKGKKNKGRTVLSLQTFLANGNAQPGVTQVAKKVRNRGDESDEEESNTSLQVFQLPTAPRASRLFEDGFVPHKPPFLAYISNLPFDVRDDDIYDFFANSVIVSLRLPREDGETGRLRGFGYIEFETRDDLINAIRLPDPQMKNRRIRIDISNENDQQKRGSGNNRSRFDGFGSSEGRDSTNWRRGNNDGQSRDNDDRRSGYGYNRDRQPRDSSQETGSWRTGERQNNDSSPRRDNYRSEGRDRYGGNRRGNDDYRKQDDEPQERPKLNLQPRTLPLPEIVTQPEEAEAPVSDENSTTPELKSKPIGVAPEKVFGSAKPVDTSAREKEIEERLEREHHEEKLKILEEKEQEKEKDEDEKINEKLSEKDEKEDKNANSWRRRDDDTIQEKSGQNRDITPDRKAPPRRNDDRRNTNYRENRDGGGRDRRDYNRGYERDNRFRDNRDRNQPRSDRDQFNRDRNSNKDNKNITRDNKPRDEKPKRENRPERPMPKLQPAQVGPVLSTSNKYSAFLDEEDA